MEQLNKEKGGYKIGKHFSCCPGLSLNLGGGSFGPHLSPLSSPLYTVLTSVVVLVDHANDHLAFDSHRIQGTSKQDTPLHSPALPRSLPHPPAFLGSMKLTSAYPNPSLHGGECHVFLPLVICLPPPFLFCPPDVAGVRGRLILPLQALVSTGRGALGAAGQLPDPSSGSHVLSLPATPPKASAWPSPSCFIGEHPMQ